ncbi:Phage integrase family protein [Brevibacterium sp. Mu109]|uniref:site-specific integrase n=1 Tax=Brevibacterium sp. Mu109 TaxID=1255669 RepID=UPI000C63A135|nr:site-specific integrase [Brevibacterium sp. Mu109]SMX92127.1 Phage integrase family protein [Brevibacterium sp. Mu109]
MTSTSHTGNRRKVPDDALKLCPSCREPRGNRRQGWEPIYRGDEVLGYTCPACPTWAEPIRRIESGRFVAVVDATPRGATKRKQAKKTLETLDEARQFVAEVRTEVAERGGLSVRELTVEKALENWLETRTKLRPPTHRNYKAQFKPLVAVLGDKPVRQLKASHVEALIASMLNGGKRNGKPFGIWAIRATVNRLSQALDRCVRDGIVPQNVARLVELPGDERLRGEALEHWVTDGHGPDARCHDLDRFREVADEHRDAGAWRLTLCGMTRADVMGLRWSDIDLDAGTATVRQGRVILDGKDDYTGETKSAQRKRTVPFETIESGTVGLLRRMKARQAEGKLGAGSAYVDSGYVVVNEAGEPLRPELYSDRFRSLCRKAGVPVINLHSVRHTLAFMLHRLGVTPGDAAALLGHTVQVHLATYLPESGASGIAAAAAALGGRAVAV